MSDITILVQGKLEEECYNFYVKNYNNFPVVLSIWDDTQFNLKSQPKNFTISYINKPLDPEPQNSNLQIQSTLNGLQYVKTKYVIKIRGDEYYSNLDDIGKLIKKDDSKIYTSPVYFRHPRNFLYHISDHLISSRKENLFKMFSDITYERALPVEVNLGINFLKKVEPNYDKNPIESMVKYFDIIDLNNHKPYMITTNCCNPRKHTNFIPEKNNSISKIEMLFNSFEEQNTIIKNIENNNK
jgi:hypothetical protein